MRIICDVEANGLDEADKIWCIAALDIDTGKTYSFDKVWQDPEPFVQFAKGVTLWIGHYFLGYDIRVLRGILGVEIDPRCVLDTLVVSRLIHFARPGGHGLESWGEECGILKPGIEEWSEYDPAMMHRCEQDVKINQYVYNKYKRYIESERWALALKIEHSTADYCRRLHEAGFPFDIQKANDLYERWSLEKSRLEDDFQRDFPPRFRSLREITPVLTRSGRLHSKDFRWYDGDPNDTFSVGSTFTLVEPIAFDPASKNQCIDRLWEAGWKPTQKTDGYKDYLRKPKRERDPERMERFERYGWKLDELNLATLPDTAPPSAKNLARWLELTGLLNQIGGWIKLYNPQTGCIHGQFMSIGAWSGRCSHSAPNMANASSYHEVREFWTTKPGYKLLGCDAEGIQLRVLAHYMNDDRFTFALTQGKKEDGTDPHTLNANALGQICLRDRPGRPADKGPRDDAKTFIYAWLLGATAGKVAEIFECTAKEAGEAIEQFVAAYPGLQSLKSHHIPQDAQRGYFEGLDGRFVRQDQERLILAGYLQNGESIIMKLARILWEAEFRAQGIDYLPVNFVHDEWQTLVREDQSVLGGEIQADAIRRAGEILKTRCPMAGKAIIGDNWSQTH